MIIGLFFCSSQYRKLLIGPILKETSNMRLLVFSLMLSDDIQLSPGPTVAQQDLGSSAMIYPCGSCRKPVTWEWYRSFCVKLCLRSPELFQHNCVSWLCVNCNNLNADNFTMPDNPSFEIPSLVLMLIVFL